MEERSLHPPHPTASILEYINDSHSHFHFPMLEVRNVTAAYRDRWAIQNVSFVLQPGQATNLLGPNGAGKSTLMKVMLGLVPPVSGSILWHNQPFAPYRQRVAYVPQRTVIDWDYPITVQNVVRMGRTRQTGWLRSFSAASNAIAHHALDRVGMADYAHRQIGELSGGQQQRVFIARALAQEADLFFLDEPFAGVDQTTETILFDLFAELKAAGKTLLVISHDFGDTLAHYDQFLLLNQTLIAAGTQSEVICPACLEQAYGKRFYLAAA
nr:metal ABC transporter ATP-binding protein [Spirulina major]